MERMKMQSLDVAGSNIDKIAKLFPQCVTECKQTLMRGGGGQGDCP